MDFDAVNREEEAKPMDEIPADTVFAPRSMDLEAAKKALKEKFTNRLEDAKEKVENLVVKDEPTLGLATEYRSGVRKLIKAVEKERDGWIEKENEYVKAVRNLAKTVLDPLKALDDTLKKKQAMGHAEIRRQQAEAEEKMRKEAEALQKKLNKEAEERGYEAPQVPEMVSPTPKKAVRTEGGASSSYKTKWEATIVDADKVPREMCSPDPKKLQHAVDQGVRYIEGCKIEERIIPIQRG